MQLKNLVKSVLEQYSLQGQTILIGLSGGPDSVCLAHILHGLADCLNLTLIAAHLDHGWREDSKNDVAFCVKFCNERNIPLITRHARDYESQVKNNGSKEAHARKIRQLFFKEVQQKYSCTVIALAHHEDDQLETFFIRLIRGSSLVGLCAMQIFSAQKIVRPMLEISKLEIYEYLAANNLNFVVDHTNESRDFLRNRIRLQLMPQLTEIDARFKQNLQATIKNLNIDNDFLEQFAKGFVTEFVTQKIELLKFQQLHKAIQNRVLIELLIIAQVKFTVSNMLLSEILKFLNSPRGGSHEFGSNFCIVKSRNLFWLEKPKVSSP